MAAPMSLYGLTLHKASHISHAIFGNFSKPKMQEVVAAHGKVLSLYRPDDDTGKVQCICSTEIFGVIRSLVPFRLVGGNRDYVVVGSDSGRINILQYNPEKNRFDKIHEETFGKSGCRRIIPGQYLAVDPKGRAVMIGAIEKMKLVYVLNRDSHANLTISSPLEAHKSHTLVFSMVGVDVAFENPVFACLEVDYEKEEEAKGAKKHLVYYELDLGLNHVTRKWSERVDDGAHLLVAVPGGTEGPSGVLVCSENSVTYKHQDHKSITAPLPRRFGLPDDRGIIVTSVATHTQKDLFFFLLQTELGDIFKVTLQYEDETVEDLQVKYFDTIAPTSSMCVLKTGFLFAASEFGNHYLFQFTGIGDDDDTPFTSAKLSAKKEEDEDSKDEKSGGITTNAFFSPRWPPHNLHLIDEMDSLSPIMDIKVADLCREHTPQIYALCGQGARSSLRVMRHGLAVTEVAVTELPGNPNAVWAVRRNAADPFMSYIVISFINATLVLSIGETVVEVNDSGILESTPTLSVSLLGDNSLLQVHANGLRHIRSDKRFNEWKPPGKKTIQKAAANQRQVVIGLSGGELVYFELDKMGNLMDVHRREMGNDISSLAIAAVPEGRQRATLCAVGSYDNTVRLLSLDPSNALQQLTLQAVTALPTSLSLISMAGGGTSGTAAAVPSTYLYVGLQNGVLVRSIVDDSEGALKDARRRFLGSRAVRLTTIGIQGRNAMLALSSRAWLGYSLQARLNTTPLSYDVLEDAAPFQSEQCPEGIVCVAGNTLRIVTLERLGDVFNQTVYPLRYTPRHMAVNPITGSHVITIESDHNSHPYKMRKELASVLGEADGKTDMDGSADGEGKSENKDGDAKDPKAWPTEAYIGAPVASAGKWGSCVRIIDPTTGESTCIVELDDNEAAFSMAVVQLGSERGENKGSGLGSGDEWFLCVGTVKDLNLNPRAITNGFIHVYRFDATGTQIKLLHKTPTGDVVLALAAFGKKLLAGVGKTLRVYELGKRKLLRKTENRQFPTTIVSLSVHGDRIYVGDQCEAFHLATYKRVERTLHVFADCTAPRYLTATCLLDYDTMVGADKFGNIFVTRLPPDVSAKIEKDPKGGKAIIQSGSSLTGAPYKMSDIVQFHVGEVVTGLVKTALVPGGLEVILYSTIMGGIGILVPFTAREDVEFFSHLEMHMRQEAAPLCGRDHLAYRSYYFPVKDCTDGDLCEMFGLLDHDRQNTIAEELVAAPSEVAKKIEEMRSKVL